MCEAPEFHQGPRPLAADFRARGPPVIVAEHSAESMPCRYTAQFLRLCPVDEAVPDALVTALVVVVLYELLDCSMERVLPQENHLAETLGPVNVARSSCNWMAELIPSVYQTSP